MIQTSFESSRYVSSFSSFFKTTQRLYAHTVFLVILLRKILTKNVCHGRSPRTTLTFGRSEHVVGSQAPSLACYDQEKCCVKEPNRWPQKLQWVFGTSKLGPSRKWRNNFVLFDSGSNERTKLLVTNVSLLFRMHVKDRKKQEIAFVQSTDVTFSLYNVDKSLGFVSLTWATDENFYYTLAQRYCSCKGQDVVAGA